MKVKKASRTPTARPTTIKHRDKSAQVGLRPTCAPFRIFDRKFYKKLKKGGKNVKNSITYQKYNPRAVLMIRKVPA